LSGSQASSGDRSSRFYPLLPTSQVLCKDAGSAGLKDRCSVLPLVGSSVLCIPSVLFHLQGFGENRSRRGRDCSSSSFLASETVVPETVVSPCRLPQSFSFSEGPFCSTNVAPGSSKGGESLLFTLWPYSGSREDRQVFSESCRILGRGSQRLDSGNLRFQFGTFQVMV